MPLTNFERMLQLADEIFDTKSDPEQLDVNEDVLNRLKQLHPASVTEKANENGPIAWILLIPTTRKLMESFLSGEISEKELFYLTHPGTQFDCIYLCSAMVLSEFRKKGITTDLTTVAIMNISQTHKIEALFVWAFSQEGKLSAQKIAAQLNLPLFEKL